MKSISTLEMPKEQWLAERRQGIGGSDVAAILGENPYKTAIDIWREKTGRIEPEPETTAMRFGKAVEDIVAGWWSQETKHKVQKDNKIRIHPDHDYLIGNIDRLIVGTETTTPGILEIKCTNPFSFKQWRESGIPLQFYLQLQHYFNVTSYKWGEIAVMISNSAFNIFPVGRDHELIGLVTERLCRFWIDNVLADKPPEPVNTEDIKKIYTQSTIGKTVEVSLDVVDSVERLKELKAVKKDTEKLIEEKAFEIQKYFGDAEAITYGGRILATWKNNKDDVKFDMDSFQKKHPDLFKQFSEPKKGARVFLPK